MVSIKMLLIALTLIGANPAKDSLRFKKELIAEFAKHKGTYGFALKDLCTGKQILINEHETFHAASTMKTPVLFETFKQASEGKFALSDSIVLYNSFKSIVDGSPYALKPEDDSEKDLYTKVGSKITIRKLLYLMITKSSNLATNIIIDIVGAENVNASMRNMGAMDIQVLRGVEDTKAFRSGKNNMVTAFDLMLLFEKLGTGKAVDQAASQEMIKILLDQHFKNIIPAKLPPNTKVASKSGFIKGTIHDSGIVYLPDGRKYVLVLLSKNAEDDKTAAETLATISLMTYNYMIKNK